VKVFKRFFKRNTHNLLFKALAGFGRSMNRFYENRNHDIFSNGESFVLMRLAKLNPSIIFDVGANVGHWAEMATAYCKNAKIYSFEPVPETYQKLINTIEHVGIDNTIAINSGLYKDTISGKINVYTGDEHSSIYEAKEPGVTATKTIDIALIKGDEFIKSNNLDFVDFVKLDVEGAEYDALLGLESTLSEHKIRMVQFEYGYINIATRILLIDCYEFFTKHGYIVGKLYPNKVEFRDYAFKHEDFIGPNFIAVRKTDIELIELLR
jgi:FkbM family methyltransferase